MPSRRTNKFPESGRGLGHVTPTIFGSTVGYPSDSLASCWLIRPCDGWTGDSIQGAKLSRAETLIGGRRDRCERLTADKYTLRISHFYSTSGLPTNLTSVSESTTDARPICNVDLKQARYMYTCRWRPRL